MADKRASQESEAAYRSRKAVMEPAHNRIKHNIGFRQSSIRGLSKILAEWRFVAGALIFGAPWNGRQLGGRRPFTAPMPDRSRLIPPSLRFSGSLHLLDLPTANDSRSYRKVAVPNHAAAHAPRPGYGAGEMAPSLMWNRLPHGCAQAQNAETFIDWLQL
jgi:hypothetical protein